MMNLAIQSLLELCWPLSNGSLALLLKNQRGLAGIKGKIWVFGVEFDKRHHSNYVSAAGSTNVILAPKCACFFNSRCPHAVAGKASFYMQKYEGLPMKLIKFQKKIQIASGMAHKWCFVDFSTLGSGILRLALFAHLAPRAAQDFFGYAMSEPQAGREGTASRTSCLTGRKHMMKSSLFVGILKRISGVIKNFIEILTFMRT